MTGVAAGFRPGGGGGGCCHMYGQIWKQYSCLYTVVRSHIRCAINRSNAMNIKKLFARGEFEPPETPLPYASTSE